MDREYRYLQGEYRYLQVLAKRLFVHQEVDYTKPNVIAAIITAAMEMSKFTDFNLNDEICDILLEAFKVENVSEVESLIGMSPNFVKSVIGYSVDFTDFSRAQMVYETQKAQYDIFYSNIDYIKEKRSEGRGLI